MNDVSEKGAVVADAVWTVDTMASLQRYVTDTIKQKESLTESFLPRAQC